MLSEVCYYLPNVAQKLEVNPAFVRFALDLLPLTVYTGNGHQRDEQ